MKTTQSALALLAAATLSACASYQSHAAAPATATGDILTGSNGMTLYVFDKDAAGSGKSLCNGPCAANWPPLYAMDGAMSSGDYTLVMRDDGKNQWAFRGKPLYYWSKDSKAGDRTGEGFNNVWHVAKP
ncbi:MAG: hypothetical protein ACM3X0_16260 [Bacteroidota bacterium]